MSSSTVKETAVHHPARPLRRVVMDVLYYGTIIACVFFFLLPLLWMLLNAFKTPLQIVELPPKLIFTPTLENFENVFNSQSFLDYIINSLVIATGSTALGLVLGISLLVTYLRRGLEL